MVSSSQTKSNQKRGKNGKNVCVKKCQKPNNNENPKPRSEKKEAQTRQKRKVVWSQGETF